MQRRTIRDGSGAEMELASGIVMRPSSDYGQLEKNKKIDVTLTRLNKKIGFNQIENQLNQKNCFEDRN